MQLQQLQTSSLGLHRVSRLWRDLSSFSGSKVGIGRVAFKRKDGLVEVSEAGQQCKRRRVAAGAQAINAATAELDVDVGELKEQLLDSLFGLDRGLNASSEVRAEISELITQLEAKTPVPSPNEELESLNGTWKLVYTANSELVPLLALDRLPLVTVGDVIQRIDSASLAVENKVFLTGLFSKTSFSTTAAVEICSPKRLQVAFQQGRIATPELLQDIEFPDTLSVLGQPVDLSNLKSALQPVNKSVRDAALQISDFARLLPDLQFPISGQKAQSWLINTYLDSDMRISRGDGGSIFVLVRTDD